MKRGIAAVLIVGAVMAVSIWAPTVKRAVPALPVVHAQNENGGCSLASLNGPYAVEGQGTVVASLSPSFPAPPFPFGEASLVRFNGNGTGSATATVNFGGVVLNAVPATITYALKSDCTGNLTVNTSLGLAIHEAFVVTGGGQRFITTDTDPFAVIQRRGERLGD